MADGDSLQQVVPENLQVGQVLTFTTTLYVHRGVKLRNVSFSPESDDNAGMIFGIFIDSCSDLIVEIRFATRKQRPPRGIALTLGSGLGMKSRIFIDSVNEDGFFVSGSGFMQIFKAEIIFSYIVIP